MGEALREAFCEPHQRECDHPLLFVIRIDDEVNSTLFEWDVVPLGEQLGSPVLGSPDLPLPAPVPHASERYGESIPTCQGVALLNSLSDPQRNTHIRE